MGLKDEVETRATTTIFTDWKPRQGLVVPETEQVGLTTGDAVKLDAVYLYADMRDSSGLAQKLSPEVAGAAVRSYLEAATHIARHFGASIRSFDGDRVMAVFVGAEKCNSAVKAAQRISWAVEKVLRPKLYLRYREAEKMWYYDHGIGISAGTAMFIRGGVRNHNDLVAIGGAPNQAAKFSDIKSGGKQIFVSQLVYYSLLEPQKQTTLGTNMWERLPNEVVGGVSCPVYGSAYLVVPT
jgi:class 3 adenylate cyclase